MSEDKRYFEGETHVKLYSTSRPLLPISVVKKIKEYLLQKRDGDSGKDLVVVDVASGSGQGTFILAEEFDKVTGFDISPGQIEEANAANSSPNVNFKVGSAEYIAVEDGSIDAVCCNMAIHWFNREIFFNQVMRVLKNDGVLAVSMLPGFGVETPFNQPQDLRDRFVAACDKFIEGILPYFDPAIELYSKHYRDIHPLPGFKDSLYITDLYGRRETTLQTQLDNLKTTSAYNILLEKDKEKALSMANELESSLVEIAGSLQTVWEFQYDIILLLGRK